jgi:hypothetical protein
VVRFWLELVSIDEDGSLGEAVSINTPGRPLAISKKGERVLSVEPRWVSEERIDAMLWLSDLRDGGAFVRDSLNLGEGYRAGQATGGQLVLIQRPVGCEPDPETTLSLTSANATELSVEPALELWGDNWGFANFDGPWPTGSVVLMGGPLWGLGRLELGLEEGEFSVNRYYSR